MQDTGYRVGSNFIAPQYTEAFAYYPDWNVDGVAVNNAHDADTFRKLDKAIIPYVSMNGVCGEKGVSVLPDEVMGMNLIFGHLRSLGHTCIGYVMHEKLKTVPIQSLHPSVELSRKSYLKAVTHLDQEPILRVTEDDPREMYVKYAIEEKGATAIICYIMFKALAVLQASWRVGYVVPNDLSVITFDDIYPSNFTIPH